MRIFTSLVLIGVGLFAAYTALAKPRHQWSHEPVDQAIGIPKIVTRVIRAVIGLLFVGFGIIGLLRTFKVIPE